MAEYTIFYSWQSDVPREVNKNFIRAAIDAAVEMLNIDVTDAERISVDSGMQNTPGSPEVATMMFDKISESAIFVGDVSLIGSVKEGDGILKQIPNPNVSIEMGFAAGVIGWQRVICILNEHYGTSMEQPFDHRNRRFPINYKLSLEASVAKRQKVLKGLVSDLRDAILIIKEFELRKARRARDQLDLHCIQLISMFRNYDSFPQPTKPNDVSTFHLLQDEDFSKFPLMNNLDLFHKCITRLLDLQLLHSNLSNDGQAYAYHWTYLGKKVKELIPMP